MNLAFDRLMGLAQQIFNQDPLSGHLFIFFNRSRDRVKILYWDGDGFCIWYKRRESGRFRLPLIKEGQQGIELNCSHKNSFKGRFWPYISEQYPYSVYDYTESRARDGPAKFLDGYQGYLHADAYAGYDHIFTGSNDSILEVACWAHARRKFFDATKSSPRESHQMVEWVRQLYDIEDQARSLSNEARQALRAQEANPILDRIEQYLDEHKNHRVPKSALSKAVWYARNQWQALRRYTEEGRLSIDNNKSERTVRHQAIGRKNWLFLGSSQAGSRAAVLFTILAGAKRHRIEPWAYLRDLLLNLGSEDLDLDELLPDRWAAKHPNSILTHRLEESRQKAAKQRERRDQRRSKRKAK